MNAASRALGEAYRRLGSLVSVRAVRSEDEVRMVQVARGVESRAEQIRREVLKLEKSL